MITAKYCGATSYTTDGVRLWWKHRNNPGAPSPSSIAQASPIEARWAAKGATCISHNRAWREGQPTPVFQGVPPYSSEAGLLEHIRWACSSGTGIFDLQPLPICSETPGPSASADYWTTHAADHIPHGGT